MRATPPSARMSAGTRSSAITATAPASSAIFACSALTTSMITPPLSISARPLFTRIVPYSAMPLSLAPGYGAEHLCAASSSSGRGVIVQTSTAFRCTPMMSDMWGRRVAGACVAECRLRPGHSARVLREGDRENVAGRRGRPDPAAIGEAGDHADLQRVGRDLREAVLAQAAGAAGSVVRLRVPDAAPAAIKASPASSVTRKRTGTTVPAPPDGLVGQSGAWSRGRASRSAVSRSTSWRAGRSATTRWATPTCGRSGSTCRRPTTPISSAGFRCST